METINLTPTPEGLRNIRRALMESLADAERNLSSVEALIEMIDHHRVGPIRVTHGCGEDYTQVTTTKLDDDQTQIIIRALDEYCHSEGKRIEALEDGIAECNKCLGEGGN